MAQVKAHTRKTKKGQVRVKSHNRKQVPESEWVIKSQVFKHKETGELRTQIPLMDINDWEKTDEILPSELPRGKNLYDKDKYTSKYKHDELGALIEDLSQFRGTEQYFYNPLFKNMKYTDGVKFLSDKIAGWLVTDILAVAGSKLKTSEFIVWELDVKDEKAVLTAREDVGTPPLYKQEYTYTDLPDGKIKLYQQNGVLMLPSEY